MTLRFDENLVVVGTGIRTVGQLTTEAIAWLRAADRVVYVITDAVGESVVRSLNPRAESLSWMYAPNVARSSTYQRMVEHTLGLVRDGERVCFAAYGHPGVFAFPTHEVVRRARAEGYRARMLPGISAEDCLFADLGIDPASCGCQSFEATDFLVNRRRQDPTSHLVLWQIGVLGEPNGVLHGARARGLPRLVARLRADYPEDHPVWLYQASLFPGVEPQISSVPLARIAEAAIPTMATLYVPPAGRPDTDWDLVRAFGFD